MNKEYINDLLARQVEAHGLIKDGYVFETIDKFIELLEDYVEWAEDAAANTDDGDDVKEGYLEDAACKKYKIKDLEEAIANGYTHVLREEVCDIDGCDYEIYGLDFVISKNKAVA